jgi:hypothetical protein
MRWRGVWLLGAVLAACLTARAQVIRFESGGLSYQALSRGGTTIMFAHMPTQVRDYSIVQVTVSNGSETACAVRPEAFAFRFADGREMRAEKAEAVVDNLLQHASRSDVIRLVSTYEIGIYGLSRYKSTSGYEQRRQAAQASLVSTKLRAAVAASAIAFVETEMKPGDSTDGALFFSVRGRALESGRMRVDACGQSFEFETASARISDTAAR